MHVTSSIMVQDRVDAYDLSAAAGVAAGLPPPAHGWHLFDLGEVSILRPGGDPDAPAPVSVDFTPPGGMLPAGGEEYRPDGYALVCFTTTAGGDPAADRRNHRRLIEALGAWLTDRGLRWCWQYDDDPWLTSSPP